jgi:hypothetical protein
MRRRVPVFIALRLVFLLVLLSAPPTPSSSPAKHRIFAKDQFVVFHFFGYVEQYKAEAPCRGDSKLSLKRAKREQTEEEAGSHIFGSGHHQNRLFRRGQELLYRLYIQLQVLFGALELLLWLKLEFMKATN